MYIWLVHRIILYSMFKLSSSVIGLPCKIHSELDVIPVEANGLNWYAKIALIAKWHQRLHSFARRRVTVRLTGTVPTRRAGNRPTMAATAQAPVLFQIVQIRPQPYSPSLIYIRSRAIASLQNYNENGNNYNPRSEIKTWFAFDW